MKSVHLGRNFLFGVPLNIVNLPACKEWGVELKNNCWGVFYMTTADGKTARYLLDVLPNGKYKIAFDYKGELVGNHFVVARNLTAKEMQFYGLDKKKHTTERKAQ